MPEQLVLQEYQSGHHVAPVSAGGHWLHLGDSLLPQTSRKLGLDGTWFATDAGVGPGGAVQLVHRPGHTGTGAAPWGLAYALAGPACRSGIGERRHRDR